MTTPHSSPEGTSAPWWVSPEVETLGPGLVLGVGGKEEGKTGGSIGEYGNKKASNLRK